MSRQFSLHVCVSIPSLTWTPVMRVSDQKLAELHFMVSQSRRNETARTRSLTQRRASAVFCCAATVAGVTAELHAAPPDANIEVTVKGDRSETAPGGRDPSIASSVVTHARLSAPGLQAQDVLRTQPGVFVIESGGFGSASTACIRGANAADAPVYLAGVRLNDDVGGTADLSMIPLWLIHRIEIYRGNAPLEADRMGPGGAIFFEPKRPTKTTGGVGYYGGSWGTSRGWAYRGAKQGALSYLVGLSADRASNRYPFVNDQGMLLAPGERYTELRRNADERTLDAWALARAELGNGFVLDWVSNATQREQGVPRLALLQSLAARQTTSRYLVSLALKGPLDHARTSTVEARMSMHHGRSAYDDPLRELALYTPRLAIDDRRIEQELAARFELSDRVRLRPAVDWAYETIGREPNDIPLARAKRQYVRLAGNAEFDVSDYVTLRGLANAECHHTGAKAGGYCDELLPTGRLGGELRLGMASIFASVGRYLRVPALGELYGVSGTVHGNRDLEPEKGRTLDLGIRVAAYPGRVIRKLYLDAFVYARWADALIAYKPVGPYVRPYNVPSARVQGLEILLGSRVTDLVCLEITSTLMDPRDVSKRRQTINDLLPYRSRLLLAPRVRLDWERPRANGISGAGAQLSALYQSSRFADPAGLGIIDEQLTFDFETYVAWFNGLLTMRGRVADLLDAKRTDLVGYPLPGRSVYVGLEARY